MQVICQHIFYRNTGIYRNFGTIANKLASANQCICADCSVSHLDIFLVSTIRLAITALIAANESAYSEYGDRTDALYEHELLFGILR